MTEAGEPDATGAAPPAPGDAETASPSASPPTSGPAPSTPDPLGLPKEPISAADLIAATEALDQEERFVEKSEAAHRERMRKLEIQKTREALRSYEQDRHEREKYARRLFWMVAVWLCSIVLIVFLKGANAGGLGVNFHPSARVAGWLGVIPVVALALLLIDRYLRAHALARKGKGSSRPWWTAGLGVRARRSTRTAYYWGVIAFLAASFGSGLHFRMRLHGFDLDVPVLTALIVSTTVNVIGLFIIVALYLFPTKEAQARTEELARAAGRSRSQGTAAEEGVTGQGPG